MALKTSPASVVIQQFIIISVIQIILYTTVGFINEQQFLTFLVEYTTTYLSV